LRNGDELIVPKKNNYVMVSGQVLNPTAVSYIPGKSAKWYLSQAGGLTQIAAKSGVFVIRADGSVISSRNNSEFRETLLWFQRRRPRSAPGIGLRRCKRLRLRPHWP
jgi:protein involved in polysaccharide export with SLBB domain